MKLWRLVVLAAAGFGVSRGADWTTEAGSPQRLGWQRREQILTPQTVRNLKLLWALRLGDSLNPEETLAEPTILGRIITHRGIKELVFATGSNNKIYAVDADLGTIFWTRAFDDAPKTGCEDSLPAPVITPAPTPPKGLSPDDENADPTLGNRPLFVLSAGGRLHELHPITGTDIGEPLVFPSMPGGPFSLNLFGGTLYVSDAGTCSHEQGKIWAVNTRDLARPAVFRNADLSGSVAAVSKEGFVYSIDDGAVAAFTADGLHPKGRYDLSSVESKTQPWRAPAPVIFSWHNTELLAVAAPGGRLLLLDGKNLSAPARSELSLGTQDQIEGLASSADKSGVRWIYVTSRGGITALRVEEKSGRPVLARAWNSQELERPSAPAVAGGVLYVLERGSRLVLHAFDAGDGAELYSSGASIASGGRSSGLAVANGHVCFGAAASTLYCFGIPVDL